MGKDWCKQDLEGNRPKGVGVEEGRSNWVEEEVGEGTGCRKKVLADSSPVVVDPLALAGPFAAVPVVRA